MPTPLSLGFDISYQQVDKDKRSDKIVVLCGWMGAKPRQLRVFNEFYNSRKFDSITFAVGPQHVLRPHTALDQMERVINAVLSCGNSSSPSRPILIFHHFSVGGYLFGQMLRVLDIKKDKYPSFRENIKAQIFDSPPDIRGVPAGLSASMGIAEPWSTIIRKVVEFYLKATEKSAGVEHHKASTAFHENSLPAPSLWYYSKADPVANYVDCETVISKWKGKGIEVETCVWADSPHIQHARVDPTRYFGTLDAFLKKNNLL
jgi:hypothetical protein